MIKKHKHEIILAAFIISISVSFYYLYGLFLPFILGMLLAFLANPLIVKIRKIVRSRNLANTLFLATIVSIILVFLIYFTQFINRDFRRLSQSFKVLSSKNKDNLDKAGQKAKDLIGNFYDFDNLENEINLKADSLKTTLKEMDTSQLDIESIKVSFQELTSMFQNDEKILTEEKPGFSLIFMFFSTIFYFILILYQYDYFESIRKGYFSNKIKTKLNVIADDFNQSFVKYFKLRTKIVLILSLVYVTAFIIMDMPGIILITTLIVLLSYIPYLQYLSLIPLSIGCLVLSIENNQSYLLYFGIVVGVFIFASIFEEIILNPKIMEKNIGMNPVIMILALSVWSYLLGIQGLLIGIPITSLIIIYIKRYFLTSYHEVLENKFES